MNFSISLLFSAMGCWADAPFLINFSVWCDFPTQFVLHFGYAFALFSMVHLKSSPMMKFKVVVAAQSSDKNVKTFCSFAVNYSMNMKFEFSVPLPRCCCRCVKLQLNADIIMIIRNNVIFIVVDSTAWLRWHFIVIPYRSHRKRQPNSGYWLGRQNPWPLLTLYQRVKRMRHIIETFFVLQLCSNLPIRWCKKKNPRKWGMSMTARVNGAWNFSFLVFFVVMQIL